MSGFVGILNLDGEPVDRALLEGLTRSLAFRGPDARQVWCQGPVGLGHALLQIASGTGLEKQPAQLDSRLWIVADARIDAREELIGKLQSKSQAAGALSLSSPDAELILHAYDVWGDACVEHLLGDFSFAIWDAPRQRLFAARDQIGLRLFYYARIGNSFLFSNTLDCLRLHPKISDRLNDLAIADFLLFGNNTNMGTTTFTDILRIPPAHNLHCSREALATRRYWTLPEEAPLQFARPQECIDRFKEIFDAAVSDRLRGGNGALMLSGGMDSPAVAVSARRVADRRGSALDLKGFTFFHEKMIPHEEKHYATLVGQALNIPIEYVPLDQARLFDNYEDPNFRTPEPVNFVMGFGKVNIFRLMSAFSRTGLTGYGGDPALGSLLSAHFRKLIKARKFGRVFIDIAEFLNDEGRFSRLYVRMRLRRLSRPGVKPEIPEWLNPDFAKTNSLRERWEMPGPETVPNHSARPESYKSVASDHWSAMFQTFDAGTTGFPIEYSHPFFDLRVLKLLLALPTLPWCSDKEILRRAARGILPDAVRLRKKSPLLADPITALLALPESEWVDRFEATPELEQYVLRSRIPKVFRNDNAFNAIVHLSPLSLNFWLRRRSPLSYNR
jgi:asparagine synthase (glutamine-hydrolysing)